MVDDPAAKEDEKQKQHSDSGAADIVELVVDGASMFASSRSAVAVPLSGRASGETVAGAVEAAGAVDAVAAAAGTAGDAIDAVANAADAAEAAGSVIGSVLGVLDGL